MDSRRIWDEYYQKMRCFIIAYVRDEWTADDLTQETFIRIQQRLDTVKDPSRLSARTFRIA